MPAAAIEMVGFSPFPKPCNVQVCPVQSRVLHPFSSLMRLCQYPVLGHDNGTRSMLLFMLLMLMCRILRFLVTAMMTILIAV